MGFPWQRDGAVDALVQWRNPRDSGFVFGSVLALLLAVRYVSLLSVVGNGALALITTTLAFRIYKSVLAAINKTSEGHPFKTFLERDLSFSDGHIRDVTESCVNVLNKVIIKLKNLFLIVNVVESIAFAFGMYVLSGLGRRVNGLTLLTLAWLLVFSVPKVYRDNQAKIDEALAPVCAKWNELLGKVKATTDSAASVASNAAKKNE